MDPHVLAQVERLATGLRHCPTVRVAKLDASSPEAAAFLNAAFGGRLAERRLPAVLLYPEAATGYVRLKGGCVGWVSRRMTLSWKRVWMAGCG